MFTGLVESTGTVLALAPSPLPGGPTRITVAAPAALAARLRTGDSIAVSGVCLTALDLGSTQFSADLVQETVERTTLATLPAGAVVNLELPTPAGAPLGGHVVQGHVDGVATLLSLEPIAAGGAAEESDWRLRLRIPAALARYVAPQGSVTVDGISLTVAAIEGDTVSIAIIPHTYAATALRTLRPGARINLEVDVLAKYAERQASAQAAVPAVPGWTVTSDYLLENGF